MHILDKCLDAGKVVCLPVKLCGTCVTWSYGHVWRLMWTQSNGRGEWGDVLVIIVIFNNIWCLGIKHCGAVGKWSIGVMLGVARVDVETPHAGARWFSESLKGEFAGAIKDFYICFSEGETAVCIAEQSRRPNV